MDVTEIIDQFKNGRERYNKSPFVNMIVKTLAQGTSPIQIIDELCQHIDKQIENYEKEVLGELTPKIAVFGCRPEDCRFYPYKIFKVIKEPEDICGIHWIGVIVSHPRSMTKSEWRAFEELKQWRPDLLLMGDTIPHLPITPIRTSPKMA